MKQYLWYNAQDGFFYENDSAYFHGLAVNAHLLAHNAKAFLVLSIEASKPFFILPDIHFFQFYAPDQFDNQKGGIKLSWEKLRGKYPEIISRILKDQRSITTSDFGTQASMETFARTVLDFQRNALLSSYQSLSRLLPRGSSLPRPAFLVAPYFHFETVKDQWYRLAIEMSRVAVSVKGADSLYGVILCSRGCLNSADVQTIARDFSESGLDGFLLWIDDFDEYSEGEYPLSSLIELVRGLSLSGRPVINLYGARFSIMLKHFGLDAVAAGICVKDSVPARPPAPAGGPAGGPYPRYYVPRVYQKFSQEEARRLTALVPQLVCNCDICQGANILGLTTQSFAERASVRRLMRRHFLRIRSREIGKVNSEVAGDMLSEVAADAALVAGTASTVYNLRFLDRWSRVLSSNVVS